MKHQLAKVFQQQFNSTPTYLVKAPGRVNLIGEHTDYNNGWVLPMAIDRYVWLAFSPRADRQVQIYSLDFQELQQFSLDNLTTKQNNNWIEENNNVVENNINRLGFDHHFTHMFHSYRQYWF